MACTELGGWPMPREATAPPPSASPHQVTMIATRKNFAAMDFLPQLAALRKDEGLTQKALAEEAEISLIQLRRYEAGSSQPTLDIIKRLAVALGVSSDALLFDSDERGPDEELRYRLEAIRQFDPDDKRVAKAVLDGLILKNQANRLAS